MQKYTGYCHLPYHPGKITPEILAIKHCNHKKGKKPCGYYEEFQQNGEGFRAKIHRIHKKAKYDCFKGLDIAVASDNVTFHRERKKQKREMKHLRKVRHTFPKDRQRRTEYDQEELG